MSTQSAEGIDNEWMALDRLVRSALDWAGFVKRSSQYNGSEITLIMADFGRSCGMNKAILEKLGRKRNRDRRPDLESMGVVFPNPTQKWDKKKIQIDITREYPSFYSLFNSTSGELNDVGAAGEIDLEGPQNEYHADEEEAPLAFPRNVMVEYMDAQKVTVKCANNKLRHYLRIPKAREIVPTWTKFRHSMPAKRLEEIARMLTGNTEAGVTMLTQQLFSIDPAACKEGIKLCGAGVFEKLSAEETIAFQLACGISASSRIMAARFLKFHNSNVSIMASEAACAKVEVQHHVVPVFHTHVTPVRNDAGTAEVVPVETEWYIREPKQVLLSVLRKWRDEPIPADATKQLGVTQGTPERVIPVGYIGDYGGTLGQGETKIQQVVLVREGGSKENYETQIACINSHENHHILKCTVMTPINDSVIFMNTHAVLLLTWDNQCDFVMVPTTIELGVIQFARGLDNSLRAHWGGAEEWFARNDIPAVDLCTVRLVKFMPYSNGDLVYQFTILGRHGFANARCMLCKGCKRHWKDGPYLGQYYDLSALRGEWELLEEMHAAVAPDTHIHDFTDEYIENIGTYGEVGFDVLLSAVLISHYIIPVLHIMLGIGNDITREFCTFITNNLEKVNSTAIFRAFHDVLRKHKVEFQKYYTFTLVGNDVKRLLDNYDAICNDVAILFHDPIHRKANADNDIDDQIDVFVGRMRQLMQVFGAVCSLMSQTTVLSTDHIKDFRLLCTVTGAMWRVYFPGQGATPKMHLLETHAPIQMEKFHCLGDKSEAGIERLHHITNKYMRSLAALPSYKRKKEVQVRRESLAEVPAVVLAGKRALDGTKKIFSPAKSAEREAKSASTIEKRADRIAAAVHTANMFLVPNMPALG